MRIDPDPLPCGACFNAGSAIVEEAFSDSLVAFARYAELCRQGDSPALCQEGGGTYYVCHIAGPSVRQRANQGPR